MLRVSTVNPNPAHHRDQSPYPLQYDSQYDIVVSGDRSGMVEYWSGPAQEYGFPRAAKFQHKIDTDLYEFAKVHVKCTYVD